MQTRFVALAFLFLFAAPAILGPGFAPILSGGMAWADDDDGSDEGSDDGGDDGSDDGGDDGSDDGRDDGSNDGSDDRDDRGGSSNTGSSGGEGRNTDNRQDETDRPLGQIIDRLFQRPSAEPARRPALPPPPPPPPPEFAPGEIVVLDLNEDDLGTLLAQGFSVIEETSSIGLSALPRRLSIPEDISLADARNAVRALPSGSNADFNHFYRSEQEFSADCEGADCPARQSIDWPSLPSREGSCGSSITIGMIDTGINEEHDTFDGAQLEVRRIGPDNFDRSQAIHGTAVAALLIGDPKTRSPGLVPGARLKAIDAFYRNGGDERADVYTLVAALGALSEEGIEVLNLSLAGPDNTVLSDTIRRLVLDRDIVVVSAVGNDGPAADPAFPAAYETVLAVTAVDRDRTVYRRAVRGPHVDLAAPGVNIWTAASISGARWKTGTSFAVPFVTAAAAMLREAQPNLTATEVGNALRARANDLGEPGPDETFGSGLLNIEGLCDEPS